MQRISLAIIGLGKIATDQHVPCVRRGADFEIVATASRNARLDGVENFTTLEELLAARPDVQAVALCVPPRPRYALAKSALLAGKHVLLEKPPGATVSEVQSLAALAVARDVSLFATWHSRYAAAVEEARRFLEPRAIRSVRIEWKEDVRHWHPGQQWIWEPGGLGVFDPGINALSILTEILPSPVFLTAAGLEFPANRATPIAASLTFASEAGFPVEAVFDWRQTGPQTWDIVAETDDGILRLSNGGTRLVIGERDIEIAEKPEYEALYDRFAALIRGGRQDVDLAPLQHVADAFLLGERQVVEPFED